MNCIKVKCCIHLDEKNNGMDCNCFMEVNEWFVCLYVCWIFCVNVIM
jgi:hypothetical protein